MIRKSFYSDSWSIGVDEDDLEPLIDDELSFFCIRPSSGRTPRTSVLRRPSVTPRGM